MTDVPSLSLAASSHSLTISFSYITDLITFSVTVHIIVRLVLIYYFLNSTWSKPTLTPPSPNRHRILDKHLTGDNANLIGTSFSNDKDKVHKYNDVLLPNQQMAVRNRRLKMISLNCQSLRNKIFKVMEYVTDCNADVILLQETWLNHGDKSMYSILKQDYGYSFLKKMRNGSKGGGLVTLFKTSTKLNKVFLAQKSYATFEFLCGKLCTGKVPLIIINFYRRPYSIKHRYTVNMFLEEFENFLDEVAKPEENLMIVGDFNLNLQEKASNTTECFTRILESFNLKQLVKEPTHVKNGILDLVIVSQDMDIYESSVHVDKSFKTDHYPIQLELDGKSTVATSVVRYVRDYNNIDIKAFENDLKKCLQAFQNQNKSLVDLVDTYNSILLAAINRHCAAKRKVYRENRASCKWYNKNLQTLKVVKRKKERAYRKNKSDKNREEYNRAKNKYNRDLEQTRSNFYYETLSSCRNDSKSLFRTVSKLTGNCKKSLLPICDSDITTANMFADFFFDKIAKIRKCMKNSAEEVDDGTEECPGKDFTSFRPISLEELKMFVSGMKSKTCKLDPVPSELVKKCFTTLGPIMLAIVNKSLTCSSFPDGLKHAVITPIIKDENKDQNNPQNYRPVSNLPFLEKLLERIAFEQLSKHVNDHNLHAVNQSSYRRHHSCETAMFKMVGDLQKSFAEKKFVAVISLDSSAAFDTIDHNLLLKRLREQFNVKDGAIKWIESFLKNRTFSVKINDAESKVKEILYGVPQGSVLGPLFYILYTKQIEELVKRHHGINIQMYADDLQLYVEFSNEDQTLVEANLGECIRNIKYWMDESFIKLNTDKTQFTVMHIDNLLQPNDPILKFNLRHNNSNLSQTSTLKILGVDLTSEFGLNRFINNKVRACNFHLRNLRNIRNCLPMSTKILLVTSLILSKLDFCNSLLAGSTDKDLKPLKRVLYDGVRFIFGINRRTHITPYLFKLHFLPIRERIRYKICLLAFKIKKFSLPFYLRSTFDDFSPTTSTVLRDGRGRDITMFDRWPMKLSKNLIFCKLISEWNSLPYQMRLIDSIDRFKTELKTHFFKLAYSEFINIR